MAVGNAEHAGGSNRITHSMGFGASESHQMRVDGPLMRSASNRTDAPSSRGRTPRNPNIGAYNASGMGDWMFDPREVFHDDAVSNKLYEDDEMREMQQEAPHTGPAARRANDWY